MHIRVAELARLVYDAFELIEREVLTSSIDGDYLVLGKVKLLTASWSFAIA